MRIVSSAIQMGSQRAYTEKNEKFESLQLFSNGNRQNVRTEGKPAKGPLSMIADAMDLMSKQATPAAATSEGGNSLQNLADSMLKEVTGGSYPSRKKAHGKKAEKDELDAESAKSADPKLDMIKQLMEKLMNRKVKVKGSKDSEDEPKQRNQSQNNDNADFPVGGDIPVISNNVLAPPPQQGGFGVQYQYHESHYESEQTQFSASGSVQTADGKQIQFSLDLSMSREYSSEVDFSFQAGTMPTDPLVVNYSGNVAELTDTKFQFDLDSDGETEAMSFLAGGSGFLALDRNGDGEINNGKELFGPESGNGFADLKAYDEDNNQFIDEGDSVYSKLRLFNKNADGTDQLSTLQSKGVGAIYLGSASTEFSMKDDQNVTQGQVRQTGVYLGENGEVGSVQQIDLAI